MDQWTKIDGNLPMAPGTVCRIWLNSVGVNVIMAAELAIAEKLLEDHRDFRVLSHSYPSDGVFQSFYFECEILPPPDEPQLQRAGVGLVLAEIAAAIIAVMIAWTVVKYYEVKVVKTIGEHAEGIEQAAGATGEAAIKIALGVAIVLVIWSQLA